MPMLRDKQIMHRDGLGPGGTWHNRRRLSAFPPSSFRSLSSSFNLLTRAEKEREWRREGREGRRSWLKGRGREGELTNKSGPVLVRFTPKTESISVLPSAALISDLRILARRRTTFTTNCSFGGIFARSIASGPHVAVAEGPTD